MSMIGNFRASTDQEVAGLLANPDTITALLYPEDGSRPEPGVEFDVDKAWHAIHFLLCGQVWEGTPPLNFVVDGGAPIGDVDVGYGSARAFTSAEVSEIVSALRPITSADLKKRFDPAVFTEQEIYPEIWDEPEEECLDNYVLHYYDALKAFLNALADKGGALVAYLN